MKFFVPFLFLIPALVFAQADPDYQELFKNLQKLRQDMQQSAVGAKACVIPDVQDCSFGDYCQKLRSQSQNFYLYKNAAGKTIPNYFFIELGRQVEGCLNQPLPETTSPDPFTDPLKLKKTDPTYKQELARVQKIFGDVQSRMIQFLLSRKTAENENEIASEIKRIQAIKMNSPLFKDRFSVNSAGCSMPNAFYQASENNVTVCPQLLNIPDATLFSLISHEIGHAIDPCNAAKDAAGTSGVAADKNPFKSVVSCLQQSSSMGAKSVTAKEIAGRLKKQEADLVKDFGKISPEMKADFKKKQKDAAASFDTERYCRKYSRNADMQEGFADWISSRLMAQKVSEIQDPNQAKSFAFEAQLFMAGSDCGNIKTAAINRISAAVEKNCPQFAEVKDSLLHPEQYQDPDQVPHPNSSRRINKILFVPPEIQKALGCKALGGTSVCE